MPYARMLKKIIAEKGYSHADVIRMCKEIGVNITEGYFSKITNEKNKIIPSEKITRAIAKVCEVDERKLIIEGYIDKAPKEILDTFIAIKCMQTKGAMKIIELQNIVKEKEAENIIEKEPLSDTIIDILEGKENYSQFIDNGFIYSKINDKLDINVTLKEPQGTQIKDNAMAPIILKGDKVIIEVKNSYNSSDIVLVKHKEQHFVRYKYNINNTVKLVPINKEYEEIIDDKDKIEVIGRVNYIIRKI